MPVRVLIVDDSALMRSFLREVLSEHDGIEVVGTAPDAGTARQKIKFLDPDVITLDIEMPGMNGLAFLEHIMRLRPMPVVMVSSLTQNGASATMRAIELGAADFVAKPQSALDANWPSFKEEISRKIIAAARKPAPTPDVSPRNAIAPHGLNYSKIVAIGGSTGSISVIQHIITSMPADGPPLLVAVHMPPLFTGQFARRLNDISEMTVSEATDGALLECGRAYISPGDRHLNICQSGKGFACSLEQGPRVNGHIPSVDVLFESVAMFAGSHSVGILLSGMGKDGAVGLKSMAEAGACTANQDEASSVIYGMPAAAVALGASSIELDAEDIPGFIVSKAALPRLPEKRTVSG